jgi:xanthine dehydrogenase accessory factor
MNELVAVLDAAADASRSGAPAVLATVVRVSGSAYRRPGARLLLCPDGRRVGLISGGCLEGDVARKAWWRTERGPLVVRYDTTAGGDGEEWAFGLGCNGVVDVLLERLPPTAPPGFLSFLRNRLRLRRVGVLARVVRGEGIGGWLTYEGDGEIEHDLDDPRLVEAIARGASESLRADRSSTLELSGADVFFEVVRPPLSLVVCGAGADVVPVVALAHQIGWHVTVCDPRGSTLPGDRFPLADTALVCPPDEVADRVALDPAGAAVVMSHNRDDDRRFLRSLLASPIGYVGVLGPRRRTDALLRELADGGFEPPADRLAGLYAPVGLDLGGDTPAEIALAILAEVRAALAGRDGLSLRDKPGPIHRGEPAGAVA